MMPSAISIQRELTPEWARELFSYEPKSGLLTWRKSPTRSRRKIGGIVGSQGRGGYRTIRMPGGSYMAHRVIWAIAHGAWPIALDHIDGNRLNNRLENLREATPSQNARNRGPSVTNKRGLKGVRWHKASSRWTAEIMVSGQCFYLGLFDDAESAAQAYDAAAIELHGSFAKTNADLAPKSSPYLTGDNNLRFYKSGRMLRLGL